MDRTKSPQKVNFLVINEINENQRIDNFLFTKLKGVPKSRIYRALRNGEIRANGKRIKPDYRLAVGDQIRIPPFKLPADETIKVPPSQKTLDKVSENIIFEDKDLIILNKPSGIAVHGGSGVSFGVIESLRILRPQAKFLELVHRLDRETSGCLLISKKSSVLKELHRQLVAKEVEKVYLALVYGVCKFNERMVEAPLNKYRLRSGERVVEVSEEGKPSTTYFRTLKRFKNITLVQAKPLTGRTHQIRIHAAHIGHPIIGDEKYGRSKLFKELPQSLPKRLFLHAAELHFQLQDKMPIAICAILDEKWLEAFSILSESLCHQLFLGIKR